MKSIIENGDELEITLGQEQLLLREGLIYDSGDGYYHLQDGVNWLDVDKVIHPDNYFD